MRIISGKYKGKRLLAPKKLPVRPTTDFAKEALFNVLNNHFYFEDLVAFDLFAGTGNISYELGSRGVPDITAVDEHAECVRYIRKTADELQLPIQSVKSDVFAFLGHTQRKADIIFADPPYEMEQQLFDRIAQLVFERDLLKEDGMLVIEHSSHTTFENHPRFRESRKYGGNHFSFFE